jgi:hypothetical protein
MVVQGGEERPKRGRPGFADRDGLWRELMRREKFFWRAGDIKLVHPKEGREETPREGDERPNLGRG